jgi:hypothetical protein
MGSVTQSAAALGMDGKEGTAAEHSKAGVCVCVCVLGYNTRQVWVGGWVGDAHVRGSARNADKVQQP